MSNKENLNTENSKKCPRCKKYFTDFPTISRRDNKTEICSACGTAEAFVDFSLEGKDQKQKLEVLIYEAIWLPANEYDTFLKSL